MGNNETTANKAAVGAALGAVVMWILGAAIPVALREANPLPEASIIVIVTWLFCRFVPSDAGPIAGIGVALAGLFGGGAPRVGAVILAVLLGAGGCSGKQQIVVGVTPAQVFYEVSGYVQVMEEFCDRYADTPSARREIVRGCAEAATEIHAEREKAVDALMDCSTIQIDFPEATCAVQDQVVRLSTAALNSLSVRLRAELVKAGVQRK